MKQRTRGVVYSTGEILSDRCRTNTCRFCVRMKTKDIARATAMSKPSHFVMLTGLTGRWNEDREVIKRWKRYCCRSGLDLHLALSIEPNPRQTGAHAHAWCWSPQDVDVVLMQDKATQVGIGSITVDQVTHHTSLGYGIKMPGWNAAAADAYRLANGRDLVHARGFWRNSDSEPISQARAIAASRYYDDATSPQQNDDQGERHHNDD